MKPQDNQIDMFPSVELLKKLVKTKKKITYPTTPCPHCGQKVPARYGYTVVYNCYRCGNRWEVNE